MPTSFGRSTTLFGAGGGGSAGGSTSQWVSSAAMIPRVTAGPGVNSSESSAQDSNYDTLDFDGVNAEGATFTFALPNNWNLGTIKAIFVFTNDSGSGTVTWTLAARCPVDGEAIDSAFGTAQSVTKTCGDPLDWNITAETPAITVAGTPAANRPTQFLVTRDPSSDNLAVDARLIGLILLWNQ